MVRTQISGSTAALMFRLSLALCFLALLIMAWITEFPWFDRKLAVSAGENPPPVSVPATGSLVVELPARLVIPSRGEVRLSLTPCTAEIDVPARELTTTYPDGPAAEASGVRVEAGGRRYAVPGLTEGAYEVTFDLADREASPDAAAFCWDGTVTIREGDAKPVSME